ncbi:manganese efflux pump MntP family protein [Shimazuella sp. AN120528]|uniref:manganese efflux pump MntP n=1 Tax=Shimazuella soli TaxID=1892854 RepID=UPI001F0DED14|nr:manganese efflux pump [Shimazuella soli]MCH5585189.1 manganese efflux pump MntP family protein [Shimazuella soli]
MDINTLAWGQFFTLSIIAIALGMDAFSLGLGLGMRKPTRSKAILISIFIAIFHIFMPLIGIWIGQYLSLYFHHIAVIIGGALLCLLGLQMFWSSIQDREDTLPFSDRTIIGIMLIAFSVSLDSLSAGLSLGFFATDPMLTVFLCGLAGGIMSWFGLYFGRLMGSWIGKYGEVFGGFVLITLGVQFIW